MITKITIHNTEQACDNERVAFNNRPDVKARHGEGTTSYTDRSYKHPTKNLWCNHWAMLPDYWDLVTDFFNPNADKLKPFTDDWRNTTEL